MSPWVRLDENAIDHPKFLALTDGAWRLWCEGQSYCQKHLTDGLINAAALKRFRYYSPSRLKNLTDVLVAGKGPVWHRLDSGDVQVHDYLDWNDSAAEVTKARTEARDRKRRFNDRNGARNAFQNDVQNAFRTPNVPSGVVCSESISGERAFANSESLADRAGCFLDRYKALYTKHRKGAHYLGKPVLDFQEAVELVRTWDDDRLDKIATVFLTTDHEFAEKGSRTIAQFRALASWCDGKLREAGL